MKCAIFEQPGLANLRTDLDVDIPPVGAEDVLVRVKIAGVNPIDYFVTNGRHGLAGDGQELKPQPLPHIPGTELCGTVEAVGERVKGFKKGDRMLAYSRLFDETCDNCVSGNELQCRNGGMLGLSVNGGFAEYVSIPSRNAIPIPDWMGWELAASLPVSALTPFHALRMANLSMNEWFAVFGASGNTGQYAVQFGKMMGAKVIAFSTKKWVKDFLGADYNIQSYENIVDEIEYVTEGKMAALILNSVGPSLWRSTCRSLGENGRIILFGTLTGNTAEIDLRDIYMRQLSIIGSTGGKKSELIEIINSNSKDLKVKVWKKFQLSDAGKALEALFSKERDGRILLSVEG